MDLPKINSTWLDRVSGVKARVIELSNDFPTVLSRLSSVVYKNEGCNDLLVKKITHWHETMTFDSNQNLESFIELSKSKFCPVVTSHGIFSVTSNIDDPTIKADIEFVIQPFNVNYGKNWTDRFPTQVKFKALLPMYASIVRDGRVCLNPNYLELCSALAGYFADRNRNEMVLEYEVVYVHSLY